VDPPRAAQALRRAVKLCCPVQKGLTHGNALVENLLLCTLYALCNLYIKRSAFGSFQIFQKRMGECKEKFDFERKLLVGQVLDIFAVYKKNLPFAMI